MDMIMVSPDLDGRAFHFFTNTAEIAVQFIFNVFADKRLSVLGAEDDVDIIFYE
jgi:hypothetical protein